MSTPPPSHQPSSSLSQPRRRYSHSTKGPPPSAQAHRKAQEKVKAPESHRSQTSLLDKSYPSNPYTRRPDAPFDPWNSCTTGHQRADNKLSGSASWRDSRTLKLRAQFEAGKGGGERVADTVGAGAEVTEEMIFGRERGQKGIMGMFGTDAYQPIGKPSLENEEVRRNDKAGEEKGGVEKEKGVHSHGRVKTKQIFRGCVIFINGSTAPLISDHKLKHLVSEHGGHISIGLTRRSVTHVILGRPAGATGGGGAGGGLAGGKMQKEIVTAKAIGVRFVGAEWVIESVKAGKRVSEAKFAHVHIASQRQASVRESFKPVKGKLPLNDEKFTDVNEDGCG